MINLGTLKAFLASLVPVSRTEYQIWRNSREMVFSTGGVISKKIDVTEYQAMSNLITGQNGFQYRACNETLFLCGIPLTNHQDVSTVLMACGQKSDDFFRYEAGKDPTARHAEEMENFLNNLIVLVNENLTAREEAKELAEELDKSFETLYLYGSIATQMKSLQFSGNILKNLLRGLLDNMRVHAAFVWLPERLTNDFLVITSKDFDKNRTSTVCFEELIHTIPPDAPSLSDNYFILNDSREDPRYEPLAMDPYRFLAVKVQHGDVFYGWLGLVCFNMTEIFRQGELRLLISLAEQVAGVIANTDLYENLEQFVVKMAKSLVFAIEAKDIYTRGHSERVSQYSMLIGKRLGLGKKESNDLKWASMLHDIGKIGIPESILNKPSRLTDAEYEVIKEHPVKGGDILKPIDQLADSLPGIIYHHERYDGCGYPQGLKGDDIPPIARIIAVADTFDAINSNRAYRETRSPEKALEIIVSVAGSQLDPRIVDVFKKVFEEDLKL
jgi:HD-GYP domain-containing protein (c-di-GMP phosphodiesterase class II)